MVQSLIIILGAFRLREVVGVLDINMWLVLNCVALVSCDRGFVVVAAAGDGQVQMFSAKYKVGLCLEAEGVLCVLRSYMWLILNYFKLAATGGNGFSRSLQSRQSMGKSFSFNSGILVASALI